MKWKRVGRKKSDDVIDIRGASPKGGSGGGGMGGLPIPTGMAGVGGGAGLIIVLVLVAIQVFGGGSGGGFDIGSVLGQGAAPPSADDPSPIPPDEDPQKDLKDFSTFVFVDTQDMWSQSFKSDGKDYEDAKLVLYSNAVSTDGCGSASSAVGPFYCPADKRVYLDLSFYEDMRRQLQLDLQGTDDFAWAYVIAHEMGHHVQNEIGTSGEVDKEIRSNPDDANELSVRLELQADCYAGVWGSTVFEQLEDGDIESAFTAAEAIGDDRLQKQAGQQVNPDSFTHGTSEQRREWFNKGYENGDPSACDTFSVDDL